MQRLAQRLVDLGTGEQQLKYAVQVARSNRPGCAPVRLEVDHNPSFVAPTAGKFHAHLRRDARIHGTRSSWSRFEDESHVPRVASVL